MAADKQLLYVFVGAAPKTIVNILELATPPSNSDKEVLKEHFGIASVDASLGFRELNENLVQKLVFVFETIFQDDTVAIAVDKIVRYTKNDGLGVPYAWKRSSPMRFKLVQTTWAGYNVNPFTVANAAQTQPTPSTNPKTNLTNNDLLYQQTKRYHNQEFNIAFAADFPTALSASAPIMKHYFPDAGNRLKALSSLRSNDKILTNLWRSEAARAVNCAYTKISFVGTASASSSASTTQYLNIITEFEKLHTSPEIPLLQCLADPSRIVYKLYKKHSLSPEALANIMRTDRLPKTAGIVAYSRRLGRFFMDAAGHVHISYRYENQTWEGIEKNNAAFKAFFGMRMNIGIEFATVRTDIICNTPRLPELAGILSKMLPIFTVTRLDATVIEMNFKRVSQYAKTDDAIEYIKSRLDIGIPENMVLEELVDELGFTKEQALQHIAEVDQPEELKRKVKIDIHKLDTIIKLTASATGVKVVIENVPDIHDVANAMHWLTKAVGLWQSQTRPAAPIPRPAAQPAPVPPRPAVQPIPVQRAPSKEKEKEEEDEDEDEEIGSISSSASASASASSGGAVDKEHQRYLLTRMKRMDPNLFADSDYSSMCQTLRQPLILTNAEKARLDPATYGESLEYGSDIANKHQYICPHIWCTKSEITMTPEQLAANNGRCPAPFNEVPLILNWDNEPSKHYPGFLSKKGKNGICLPCCFKKPEKAAVSNACKAHLEEKPPSPFLRAPVPVPLPLPLPVPGPSQTPGKKSVRKSRISASETVDEGYLITKIDKLPAGRLGTIPRALHQLIQPTVPYETCSSGSLSSQKCLLRRGIDHGKDSFMNTLAYIMGKSGKAELIKFLKAFITPEVFIQLEGGAVLATFLNSAGAAVAKASTKTSTKTSTKDWATRFPDYTRMFGSVEEGVEGAEGVRRTTAIAQAYARFWEYLKSDEIKNPYILYDAIVRAGVLIVIWDRNTDGNTAYLRCPVFTSVGDIVEASKRFQIGMMLCDRERGYYEPLELKQRGGPREGTGTIMRAAALQQLAPLLKQCPSYGKRPAIIDKLKGIVSWMKNLLAPAKFAFDRVVLLPDYRIGSLITKGGIWVDLPEPLNIQYLSEFLDILVTGGGAPRILYHEDIVGENLGEIFVPQVDLKQFIKKLGTGVSVGALLPSASGDLLFRSRGVTVKPVPGHIVPLILLPTLKNVPANTKKEVADTKREYQTRQQVGKALLAGREAAVPYGLGSPGAATQLQNIMAMSKGSTSSKSQPPNPTTIRQWMAADNIDWFSTKIYDLRREWLFSQAAFEVAGGLPDYVIIPLLGPRPSKGLPLADSEINIEGMGVGEAEAGAEAGRELPAMLRLDACDIAPLPSKWTTAILKGNRLWRLREYSRDSLGELFEWIGQQLPLNYKTDIIPLRNRKVSEALGAKDRRALLNIFGDPSMRSIWGLKLKKTSFKSAADLVDKKIMTMSADKLLGLWQEIVAADVIWPFDVDLVYVAHLLQISILVLHQAPYGAAPPTDAEELRISSSLFMWNDKTWAEKPVLIMHKKQSLTASIYGIVAPELGVPLQEPGDLSESLRELLNLHVSRKGDGASPLAPLWLAH